MGEFPGVGHLALTVSDLSVSAPWYRRLFDADPIMDRDTGPFREVAWLLPGGFIFALHGFPDGGGNRFDERQPGLDHAAFHVGSRAELVEWERRLDEMGVAHGAIKDAPHGSALALRDPDNVQLELWANAD